MAQRLPMTNKAYKSERFLDIRQARPLRILAEYIEPESRFEHYRIEDTIVFFGSARIPSPEDAKARLAATDAEGEDLERLKRLCGMSRYYDDARRMAKRLTEWSKWLTGDRRRFVVCTGGGPGIMEAANRGAAEAKGLSIGLTISLPVEEFDNPYVTRELAFEFHYFFIRKFWFAYLAKAVIAMPGGFGTLDELFEMLTLIQTLKMKKKLPIVLFGSEYWDTALDLRTLVDHGTISPEDVDLFHRTDAIDNACDYVVRELTADALGATGPTM